MGHCEDCKHWREYDRGHGHCNRVGHPDAKFWISDGCGLSTRHDFSCCEFEREPDKSVNVPSPITLGELGRYTPKPGETITIHGVGPWPDRVL